jgi:hypothetical protein
MKNIHIIIESNFNIGIIIILIKKFHLLIIIISKNWSLKCYWIMIFNFFFVQMILNFQKEINVIMYIIEIFKKVNSNHFIWTKSQ